MTELFYPVTEDMPALNVRVVVIWGGREFKAARVADKMRNVRWATEEGGQLVYMPPRGREVQWGLEPPCWRPERPDLWKAPLPAPIVSCRLTGAGAPSGGGAATRRAALPPEPPAAAGRNRYAAMAAQSDASDRTRAELVAEFGEIDDGPPTSDKLWWLTERLTYSPRGEISEREAEGRIARAILTDGIRGSYGGPQPLRQTSSALSQFIHSSLHSTDAEDMIEAFAPTPRDLSDYAIAFGWFAALAPYKRAAEARHWEISHRQKVLVWRITGSSWRRLASLAGGSHTGAKKVYGGIIAEVTRIANSPPIDWTADVRERSRLFRTRGDGGFVDG